MNPGAQLGSASTNARGRHAGGKEELATVGSGGGRAGSADKARPSGADSGTGRRSGPSLDGSALEGGGGPARAYPKPWRVGAAVDGSSGDVGGVREEGSSGGGSSGGGRARSSSARDKLGPLPTSTPPRPPGQRLLQSGTDQALVPSGTGAGAGPGGRGSVCVL